MDWFAKSRMEYQGYSPEYIDSQAAYLFEKEQERKAVAAHQAAADQRAEEAAERAKQADLDKANEAAEKKRADALAAVEKQLELGVPPAQLMRSPGVSDTDVTSALDRVYWKKQRAQEDKDTAALQEAETKKAKATTDDAEQEKRDIAKENRAEARRLAAEDRAEKRHPTKPEHDDPDVAKALGMIDKLDPSLMDPKTGVLDQAKVEATARVNLGLIKRLRGKTPAAAPGAPEPGGAPSKAQPPAGARTAVNPKTGAKVFYDPGTAQWVPY